VVVVCSAQARLSLSRPTDALRDCVDVLERKGDHVKVWMRLATSLEALQAFAAAALAFEAPYKLLAPGSPDQRTFLNALTKNKEIAKKNKQTYSPPLPLAEKFVDDGTQCLSPVQMEVSTADRVCCSCVCVLCTRCVCIHPLRACLQPCSSSTMRSKS
jgi:hypothetical protein